MFMDFIVSVIVFTCINYPYFPKSAMRQVGKILLSVCLKKQSKLAKGIQLVISAGTGTYSFIYITFFSALFNFNYICLKYLN